MGGEGAMSGANISLANNRALLKKRRLKDHPYMKADSVSRLGRADYEELKAWRLQRSKTRQRRRWLLVLIYLMVIICGGALALNFLV